MTLPKETPMIELLISAVEAEAYRQEIFVPNRAAMARSVLLALLDPTEAMWDGSARQIIMWMVCGERATPRSLFRHLERSGHEVPDWLRDEPEMKNLDHVPSKGTRAVLIFKAMIDAALTEGEG